MVCLLDLSADFGVKKNAKLTALSEQNWYEELFGHRNTDVYSLLYNFSD